MHTNDYRSFFFFFLLKQNLYLLDSKVERNYQEFEAEIQYQDLLTTTGDGLMVGWQGSSTEK